MAIGKFHARDPFQRCRAARSTAPGEVLAQRLQRDLRGQPGRLAHGMAQAGVDIEATYSDHDHPSIPIVVDARDGRVASETWKREAGPAPDGSNGTRPSRSRSPATGIRS